MSVSFYGFSSRCFRLFGWRLIESPGCASEKEKEPESGECASVLSVDTTELYIEKSFLPQLGKSCIRVQGEIPSKIPSVDNAKYDL